MAEDRGFLEKLLKPTEEEKEDVKKKLEKAFQTQRGIEKIWLRGISRKNC